MVTLRVDVNGVQRAGIMKLACWVSNVELELGLHVSLAVHQQTVRIPT